MADVREMIVQHNLTQGIFNTIFDEVQFHQENAIAREIDPTICEKFNTYKFSDYKEHVIDLLMRVTTVSVETMATTV